MPWILTIKGQCSYKVEVGKDALGNLQRISNALCGIEKKVAETQNNQKKQRHQRRITRRFTGTPSLMQRSMELQMNTLIPEN